MGGVTFTRTDSASVTFYFDEGEQVYPCRCGETHRGPYGAYDYDHHNCMHDSPLIALDSIDPGVWDGGDFMCGICGKSFRARNA